MTAPADVCLVVEGCYPYVAGGVSTWLDWLIRSRPELRFSVIALVSDARPRTPLYAPPENLIRLDTVPLSAPLGRPPMRPPLALQAGAAADLLEGVLRGGDPAAFAALIDLVDRPALRRGLLGLPARARRLDPLELMTAPLFWRALETCCRRIAPEASFEDFFWAWRFLLGGVAAVLAHEPPPARIYHAIATGFAGLSAARASRRFNAPLALTEHGIYTSERRIDVLTADWIADVVAAGLAPDPRPDMRRVWVEAFESFARIVYAAATRVTTLYAANQGAQRALGAQEAALEVIPNGVRLDPAGPPPARKDGGPRVALIGRVTPIKDVKTFIHAVDAMRRAAPGLRAHVLGPEDEDPGYAAECRALADRLGLGETLRFEGRVAVGDWLPRLDLVMLTSVSEAQPLVLLEAGAAGVPCVATDVGSCREIVDGPPGESPPLGPGGRIAPPMDSAALAEAAVALLSDEAARRRCGAALRRRVETAFTEEASAARYAALYRALAA